jgi:biopolymer transport protein ExbD
MRLPDHSSRTSAGENQTMTPMIDVVFLLLVFFVCASVGQTPDLLLPAALSAGTTTTLTEVTEPQDDELWDHQQVRIRLSAISDSPRGLQIELNEGQVNGVDDLERRLRRLAQADLDSQIILDTGDTVSTRQFISIYDLCQLLKFRRISLATRSSAETSEKTAIP